MAHFEKELAACFINDTDIDNDPGILSRPNGLKFFLRYADTNHLLLGAVSKLRDSKLLDITGCKQVEDILNSEQEILADLLGIAKTTQEAFDKAKCQVILMKFFFQFPYTDDDLDFVLVNKSFGEGKSILKTLGFHQIKNRSHIREPLKRLFYCRNKLYVHLHSKFSWNGVGYLNGKDIWDTKAIKTINRVNISVPCANYDLLITAAHAIFENKCIYLSDFINIVNLSRSGKINWDNSIRIAHEQNWEKALLVFLGHINLIYKSFFNENIIPVEVPSPEKLLINDIIVFPFIIKGTFSSSFTKLFLDMLQFRFSRLPRQLLSYSLVDYLLYKRAIKSKIKLEDLYAHYF